jgi:RecA-family ATPase
MSKELEEQAEAPVKLIVFDHARLVGAGDSNDGSHVTELTRVLTNIAQETGAAVVLIGHSPKSIHGKTENELSQSDVVGSGAYVDNARSTLLMTTLSDGECKRFGIQPDVRANYARLQVVKNNYGKTGTLLYFHRRYDPTWQVAPLDPVKLSPASKAPAVSIEKKIAQDLASLGQVMSKTSYCERRSGAKGSVGVSEKQMRMHVERMLMCGQLEERPPTDAERMQHRLSHNTRLVLVPGKLSGARCPDDLFVNDETGQKI